MMIILFLAYLLVAGEACDPFFAHPQSEFCESDFVATIHINSPDNTYQGSEFSYKASIGRVFRGGNILKDASIDNSTLLSNGPMNSCGSQELQVGESYLVLGYVTSDGYLRASALLPPQTWESASETYKQDMALFDCSCEVLFDWNNWDNAVKTDKNCVPSGIDFCVAFNSVCVKSNGVCNWVLQPDRCD